MKCSDWFREYHHISNWALRMIYSPREVCDMCDKKLVEWQLCLEKLLDFDTELLDYLVISKNLKNVRYNISSERWFELTHKYIEQARKENKTIVALFFFTIWTDMRTCFKDDKRKFILGEYSKFVRDATKEEIEQATKDFGHYEYKWNDKKLESDHTFNKVLEYRDVRFPVDDQWGDAWTRNKNGEVRHFQLEWDWWYPIDEYLDLEYLDLENLDLERDL